jgi:hypothetical protein
MTEDIKQQVDEFMASLSKPPSFGYEFVCDASNNSQQDTEDGFIKASIWITPDEWKLSADLDCDGNFLRAEWHVRLGSHWFVLGKDGELGKLVS